MQQELPATPTRKHQALKAAVSAALASLIALGPGNALAQAMDNDEEAGTLEEVLVTARKRSESIFDVPISISVISEQLIENLGAQDFTDLLRSVPGLTAYQNGPGRTRLYIRGVANGAGNDNDTQNGETVSIYLDEIPISLGAMNPEIALFDLERVEVLRGPQGTLYGAGSMTGTIRQVSNKPDLSEVEGRVEAGYADISHGSETYTFKGLVNLPLVEDTFAIRASAYYTDFGGYIDNIQRGEADTNDGTTKGARIAARWMISDNFSADFSVMVHDYSDNGRPEDHDATPFLTREVFSFDGYDDELDIYNLTLIYDLGWSEIVSSTSYFDRSIINRRSLDTLFEVALPPGITPSELVDSTDTDTIAQEIRLSSTTDAPLQWTVGFYADKKDMLYLNTFPVPGADAIIGTPSSVFGAPADNLFWGFDDLTVETYAFFGEAYYSFGDFTLTGGLRYFNWQQDIEFYQSGLFNGGANSDPRPQGNDDGVNPKLSLSYDVNESLLVYGTASRGYRYGGINGAIPESVCADELAEVDREGGDVRFFDPDSLWNYEIGAKGTSPGGAVSFSAAAFVIKWDDMQTSRAFDCGFGFRENVGKATSQGIELEMQAAVGDGWTLGFGGAYVDATLDEDVPNLAAQEGDSVPYVPEWSFNATAQYDFAVWKNMEWFAWSNAQYVGDRKTEFNAAAPNYREMDAYTIVNARIGFNWETWEFSLIANNLFDDDGVVRALRRPPFDPDAVIRTHPRTVGVTVRKFF